MNHNHNNKWIKWSFYKADTQYMSKVPQKIRCQWVSRNCLSQHGQAYARCSMQFGELEFELGYEAIHGKLPSGRCLLY